LAKDRISSQPDWLFSLNGLIEQFK